MLAVSLVVLFAIVPLMLTLLALLACNLVACLVLLILRRSSAAGLAFLTCVLLVASLLFTDWGFSMPYPRIRVSWFSLIPACVSELALITMPLWPFPKRSAGGG